MRNKETEREEKTGKAEADKLEAAEEEEKSIERDDAGLDAGEETEEGKLERFWDDRDNYGKAKNTKETEIVGVPQKKSQALEHGNRSVSGTLNKGSDSDSGAADDED